MLPLMLSNLPVFEPAFRAPEYILLYQDLLVKLPLSIGQPIVSYVSHLSLMARCVLYVAAVICFA